MDRDYSLADAFKAFGCRLFGSEWQGQEIESRKVQDPEVIRKVRAPFEAEMTELNSLIQAKDAERREAVSKDDLDRINSDLFNLDRRQQELFSCLNEVGFVRDSDERDSDTWQRFERTEMELLRAFREGELYVFGVNSSRVEPRLWLEMPEGFGWNWGLSLIFRPPEASARPVDAGKITCAEFEDWLAHQTPLGAAAEGNGLTPDAECRLWLRTLVKDGRKPTKRDALMKEAQGRFSGLSERAFKTAWSVEAPESWKKPGKPRKSA